MAAQGNMTVSAFAIGQEERYLRLVSAVDAESGTHGAGHSHAYSRSEAVDVGASNDREIRRWTTNIHEIGWRRAWGLTDWSELVGFLYLAGGALRSELHRVNMGMGILSAHHRRGGGAALLETVIGWATDQPTIDWIDLGVFSDNPGAQALYAKYGFEVRGHIADRFRVDGESLGEISMTLHVASTRG